MWPGQVTLDDIVRAVSDCRPGAAGWPSQLPADLAEDLAPGAELAQWLAAAPPAQLDSFHLAGVAAAWHRLAAWAQACEFAAVAEMAARAAARDSSIPLGPDGSPALAPSDAADEVALALRMSRLGGAWWVDLAVSLSSRLPATLDALRTGDIDFPRARLIVEATGVLDADDAHAVQDKVLPAAGRQTLGQLRASLRRAVISVDPEAAERRRAEAEHKAKVGLYSDEEGTATLAGHNLPGAQSTAAMARITAIAQAMKAAGAAGGIDLLRAKTYLGLLLGTLPLIPPSDGGPEPPEPAPDGDRGATPSSDSGSDDDPADHGPRDGGPAEGPRGAGPRNGAGAHGLGRAPADSGPDSRPDSGPRDTGPDSEPGHTGPGGAWAGGPGGAWGVPDWGAPGSSGPGGVNDTRGSRTGWNTDWPGLPGPGERPGPGCALDRPARTAPPSASRPTGRVRLTASWLTLAGLSGEPGEVCWLGPVTRVTARALAAAAASEASCRWQVVVAGPSGEAVAVTRLPPPGRGRRRGGPRAPASLWGAPQPGVPQPPPAPHRDAPRATAPPGGPPATLIGQVTVVVSAEVAAGAEAARHWVHGAAGNCEPLAEMLLAALEAARAALAGHEAAGSCDHRSSSSAYRPPGTLREFVVARDQTCRFPGCRQPAWRTDLDHTVAFDKGGRTCRCNLGPLCRAHHQLKQRPGWRLLQPAPGTFVWTTPAGRQHTLTPSRLCEPEPLPFPP